MDLGRYRLVEVLGTGATGEVWRARDSVAGRMVALKLLRQECSADDEFVRRFRHEVRTAAAVDSPHLVPIHDFGVCEGRLFIDMRLIDGRDLRAILQQGPLAPEQAVAVVDQVASALNAAHRHELVHRDVKPANILVAEHGFVYLTDFGLARAGDGTAVTSTGLMLGTWAYRSPEQFGPGEVDSRVDVYALSCVLYECLTGLQPFTGETMAAQFVAHRSAPPPRPSQLNRSVPQRFDPVIARGMAKDPAARFSTVMDLAAAARFALGEATPTRDGRRFGVRTLMAAGVISVAVIAASTVVAPQDNRDEPTDDVAALFGVDVEPATSIVAAPAPHISYGPQIVLPFAGLASPRGTMVTPAGDVYIADMLNARILFLPAGASEQVVLPFAGLDQPVDVAVNDGGDVYVVDFGAGQLLELAAGSTSPTVLPLVNVIHPGTVAVDSTGEVYTDGFDVADAVRVAAGERPQIRVPFNNILVNGLGFDIDGAMYAVDITAKQVVRLSPDWSTQTTVLREDAVDPDAIALDASDNLYVGDFTNAQVLRVRLTTGTYSVLPFKGLRKPIGVGVDSAGNVYVADAETNQVLKLPVR